MAKVPESELKLAETLCPPVETLIELTPEQRAAIIQEAVFKARVITACSGLMEVGFNDLGRDDDLKPLDITGDKLPRVQRLSRIIGAVNSFL